MRKDKIQGYWEKRQERFSDGTTAKARASSLRASSSNIQHVTLHKNSDGYIVSYSVAKWYVKEMKKSGITL